MGLKVLASTIDNDVIDGVFVERTLDLTSMGTIHKLCETLGTFKTTDPRRMHCTIMYSPDTRIPVNSLRRVCKPGDSIPATITGVDLFGKDGNVLVLRLSSNELQKRHEVYKAIGCEPTYPEYKPHITISQEDFEFNDDVYLKGVTDLFKDLTVNLINERYSICG